MTKLFISFKFGDEESRRIATQVRDDLSRYGIQGIIAGDLTTAPPPEIVRSLILSSDGLLAIITSTNSDWIQNEIGIAYAACSNKIWGLVKEGIEVHGILPRITTYARFRSLEQYDLKKKVAIIASELRGSSGIQAVIDQTEMLTGLNGTLQIAIKPRNIPSGEDIIDIYIPPEFNLQLPESDESAALAADTAGLPRNVTTNIPVPSACRILLLRAGQNDAFPGFTRFQIALIFPQAAAHLVAGWAEFRLNYTAPATAGTYRFYARETVAIPGNSPQEASSFEFEQMTVKGEISPVYLSGILSRSPNVPLNLSGRVSAIMTTRLDPQSGDTRDDIPNVNAVCYLSAKDEGRYKITGLAPGIYDIYAEAFPFSAALIHSNLRIYGQPPSIDGQVSLTTTLADNAGIRIRDALNRERARATQNADEP